MWLLPHSLLPPTNCPWCVTCNKTTALVRKWYRGIFCAGRRHSTDRRPKRSPGPAWWWSCKAGSDRCCPARGHSVSDALLWQPWRRKWRCTGRISVLPSPGTYKKLQREKNLLQYFVQYEGSSKCFCTLFSVLFLILYAIFHIFVEEPSYISF